MGFDFKFITKEKLSVGLDIGTQSIKMVSLRLDREKAELYDFALEPNQPQSLSQALKRITQLQEAKRVNVSLSGLSTVTRYVAFPKMSAEELKQALKFEAQKHIPFTLNEVNMDAQIIKEGLADNKMLVLIAAVKKDAVERRLKDLEAAALKANLVDIDSIALLNAFNFNYAAELASKHKVTALLNVGSQASNLNIMESGVPRFSRDIHIAGHNFSQKIADVMGMDFNAGEKLKINAEKESADDKIKAAVEAVFTNLAGEIRNSFDYYESQSTSSVEKIFLSGGGSKLYGFKDMLANFLGITADYWDPFKAITLSAKTDSAKVQESSSELAVAVGLALRR
ncbi:MAG: type IV pilus assembly protein PilM [Candidatus Omnitrophica bacterium]|nr:type IV pilus assembly protein PilM [Candidatus Omnitrophota bacterium]MBL7210683.1 type IV pilus assembly protein PilM [Candidatus Omnitrophota bacterium]